MSPHEPDIVSCRGVKSFPAPIPPILQVSRCALVRRGSGLYSRIDVFQGVFPLQLCKEKQVWKGREWVCLFKGEVVL